MNVPLNAPFSPILAAQSLSLRVAAVLALTDDIRYVELVAADGARLPSFPPGGNLPVEWTPGRFNSYSLTGMGLSLPLMAFRRASILPDGADRAGFTGLRWAI